MKIEIFKNIVGFQWDKGNLNKNFDKHSVSNVESEEVFFNMPLLLFEDKKHSQTEVRYYLLGKTNNERKLYLVFTIRNKHIRVISARDMNVKERSYYEQKENS
jgi:uncharacterized DUF497 family protein